MSSRFVAVLLLTLLVGLSACTPGCTPAGRSVIADSAPPDAITTSGGGKEPADSLDGPPFVTCKAWAIADAKTGELLFSHDPATARKTASTTKIMCATVVLQLAAANPAVLDEILTFSKLADDTGGSTSGINAGEKIAVRDCLYALLLPSGNDAGNALAEHFNDRFDPPASADQPANSRSNFVAQMNRLAARIGMTDSTFRIPYGDGGTPEDATMSPRDLIKLARFAMQDARFRKIVATPHYECDIILPGANGSVRTGKWDNTNQLLAIEGYDGIKTGTTNQAGACLVTSARRDGKHLFLVVLGSTSPDARFTDTRNLARYAWQELGVRD